MYIYIYIYQSLFKHNNNSSSGCPHVTVLPQGSRAQSCPVTILPCIFFVRQIVEVTLPPFPVTGMQTAEVYISHLVSPGDFHVQFSTTEEELERLAEKAAQLYDGPKSENYKVNNPQQVNMSINVT